MTNKNFLELINEFDNRGGFFRPYTRIKDIPKAKPKIVKKLIEYIIENKKELL